MIQTLLLPPRQNITRHHIDLDIIKALASKWRILFNPDPNKQAVEVTFSMKRVKTAHPDSLFGLVPVVRVEEHKHLGVILVSKLSFANHIKTAITKSRQGISMIKYLSKYLPGHKLNELYKLYVRPHLDYGDVIYHTQAKICEFSHNTMLSTHMENLESVQYFAALAVTGSWKGTSREKLYNELGWESLNLRRWSRRLVMFYKIANNITPEYTRHPIPQIQQSTYSLREQHVIGKIRARAERFKNSFYPNCLNQRDKLLPEVRQAPSLSVFRLKLLALISVSFKTSIWDS